MNHDEKLPIAIPLEQIREMASSLAGELRALPSPAGDALAGGGSARRELPPDVRTRLIEVRAALFQRGIYDPVLVRFDSATAPPASNEEIAEQLTTIATSIG